MKADHKRVYRLCVKYLLYVTNYQRDEDVELRGYI